MNRLLKRADFLAAAAGQRASARAFVLQARKRGSDAVKTDDDCAGSLGDAPRMGYTVTRKVGNAVVRNRIRRRMRAAIAETGALVARPGFDYVLIGRREALAIPYEGLIEELKRAFGRIHRDGPQKR